MSGFMAFDHDTPMEYARKALNMDWSFQFENEDSGKAHNKDWVTNSIIIIGQ